MDNTNYLLEFNIPGSSSGFEKLGHFKIPLERSRVTCFCCLATNVPVVNASICNHTEFVKLYFKRKSAVGLWICYICHYMLKKIELFRFQVYKSFNNLNKKVPQGDSNWKLINELTKNNMNSVSILSIVKSEPEGTVDPLEVTNINEQEIEFKMEPEFDSETNTEPTNIYEPTIQTFSHNTSEPSINTCNTSHMEQTFSHNTSEPSKNTCNTSHMEQIFSHNTSKISIKTCNASHTEQTFSHNTSEPSNTCNTSHTEPSQDSNLMKMITLTPNWPHKTDTFEQSIQAFTCNTNKPSLNTCSMKHTETSQNLNLMKMINLTPTRQQKKENPLLKTMLTTEGPFSVQNYIKILPKPDGLTKSKGYTSFTLQDTCIEDKLADAQDKRAQNLLADKKSTVVQEKEDDKIYSLLHKPSSVIDSTYEGKIMQLNITQEELNKERDDERNKTSFQAAKYKCDSCIRVFDYEFALDKHNSRQHKEANAKLETVCPICKCVYSKAAYKNHFTKHFKRFVCVECNEDSTDLPKLALHFNKSHPEKEPIPLSYWCNDCDFKTDAILKYRQHRKTHRTQKCNICNRVIYVKMRTHMKSHHNDEIAAKKRAIKPTKSYKCEHCDRTYILPATLRSHVRVCHSNDTNTYYCDKCDKQFKTESIYRVHLTQSSAHASIEEVFKYICDFCGKKTKYKDIMESHIEREHLKTQKYKCEPCNKIFGSDRFLQRHINFVHNKHKLPKNKICQYCGKAFAIMPELSAHLLSHTDERPLSCEICNKTYRHGSALRYHRKKVHKIPPKRKTE